LRKQAGLKKSTSILHGGASGRGDRETYLISNGPCLPEGWERHVVLDVKGGGRAFKCTVTNTNGKMRRGMAGRWRRLSDFRLSGGSEKAEGGAIELTIGQGGTPHLREFERKGPRWKI